MDIKITLETLYDFLRNEKKKEDLQELEETFFFDVITYLREKKATLETKQESENIFAASEKDKLEYELRSIKRILKELYEKREKKIIDIALNKSRTSSDIIDTGCMLREEKMFYEEVVANLDKYRKGVLLKLFKGDLPDVENKVIGVLRSKPAVEEKKEDVAMTKIKFTNPTPSFVWKDMKVYGPYDVGDEIEIFSEVAALLVRKGRAEEV